MVKNRPSSRVLASIWHQQRGGQEGWPWGSALHQPVKLLLGAKL